MARTRAVEALDWLFVREAHPRKNRTPAPQAWAYRHPKRDFGRYGRTECPSANRGQSRNGKYGKLHERLGLATGSIAGPRPLASATEAETIEPRLQRRRRVKKLRDRNDIGISRVADVMTGQPERRQETANGSSGVPEHCRQAKEKLNSLFRDWLRDARTCGKDFDGSRIDRQLRGLVNPFRKAHHTHVDWLVDLAIDRLRVLAYVLADRSAHKQAFHVGYLTNVWTERKWRFKKKWSRWLQNLLARLATGYWGKPMFPASATVIVVFAFAASYWCLPPSALGYTPPDSELARAIAMLHFSVVTLTTLGYGNIAPDPTKHCGTVAMALTAIEALLGYGLLATFIAVLIRYSGSHSQWRFSRELNLVLRDIEGADVPKTERGKGCECCASEECDSEQEK